MERQPTRRAQAEPVALSTLFVSSAIQPHPKGIEGPNVQLERARLKHHVFHNEWNYTILPRYRTGDCPNFRGGEDLLLEKAAIGRENGTVPFGCRGTGTFFGVHAIYKKHDETC
jgi:hypothetical protein